MQRRRVACSLHLPPKLLQRINDLQAKALIEGRRWTQQDMFRALIYEGIHRVLTSENPMATLVQAKRNFEKEDD